MLRRFSAASSGQPIATLRGRENIRAERPGRLGARGGSDSDPRDWLDQIR